MKKTIKTVVAMMSGVAALASSAKADLNVQLFNPSTGSKYTYTENAQAELPDGEVPEKYVRYLIGVNYNFVHDPLVVLNEERTERLSTTVSGIQTMNIMGGVEYNGRIAAGIDVPINVVHLPGSAAQFGMGDLRLFTKAYLLNNKKSKFGLSLMPELKLPTGYRDLYLSDGSISFGIMLGGEYDFGKVSMAANIGYRRVFNGGQFDVINFQNQIPMKLGIAIPIGNRWAINAEGTGTIMAPFDRFQLPAEFYAGARFKPTKDMVISLGAAVGSFNRIGSSDFRILAGLKFYPAWKKYAAQPLVVAPQPVVKPVVKAVEKPRVQFTAKAVVLNEEVRFEHNSDVLTPSGKSLLDEVAKVLKENRAGFAKIKIEGHTNEIGSQPYNLVLSTKRANSVRLYLISRGIDPRALDSIGYGKLKPKSAGMMVSREVRLEMDRRVEFKVISPVKSVKKEQPAAPARAESEAAKPRA